MKTPGFSAVACLIVHLHQEANTYSGASKQDDVANALSPVLVQATQPCSWLNSNNRHQLQLQTPRERRQIVAITIICKEEEQRSSPLMP